MGLVERGVAAIVRPTAEPGSARDERFWPGYLYRARRILLDGGALFILADSRVGRAAFAVPLPGGPMIIRSGWLTLCRLTGARVIPVVTHLEGRTQVITIHPALPTPAPGDADPLATWREIITVAGQRLCPAISRAVPVSGVSTDRLPAKTGAGWVGTRRARTAADGQIRQNVIGVWRRPKGRAIL